MSHFLEATHIVYRRAKRAILRDLSFSFDEGEVVAVLGSNGAGKTTLLRLLLGLLRPDSGQVLLGGLNLTSYSRRALARLLAYVPQNHSPVFPYTVRQVVSFGRIPHTGLSQTLTPIDHRMIDVALDRFTLQGLASRPYSELSGGERQRVLLARAVAQESRFIVMDEPLSGLDPGHQYDTLKLLKEQARQGIGIVHTIHRPEDAIAFADRAVLLDQGRIIADGAPREVLDSATVTALYGKAVEQFDVGPHRFFAAER